MNLEGTVLKLLLEESNPDKALQTYSELHSRYFTPAFQPLFNLIHTFYDQHHRFPSLAELKIFRNSDLRTVASITTLEMLDTDGVELDFAATILADQHAQNVTLDLINNVLSKITLSDRYELLEEISALPLRLEAEIDKSNSVFSIRDIDIFSSIEVIQGNQILSGISDEWDFQQGGYWKGELVLYGGKRGSGKSVVCANLVANQHKQGKPSVYFTIEMSAEETMKRILGIIAGVSATRLKNGKLTEEEIRKLAWALASLYEGGDQVFEEHFSRSNPNALLLQQDLRKLKEKDEGRIVIVDDRDLTIPTVDTKLAYLKSLYGDIFSLAVVDYLNQLRLDSNVSDMYDWKDQVVISKTLKNLARKHDVCIVAPYQMDDEGKARFSKGILDACDTAQLIRVEDKASGHIQFDNTKMRSGEDGGSYKVSIDWDCLVIDPRAVVIEDLKPEKKTSEKTMDLEL